MLSSRWLVVVAAFSGFLCVAIGAMGSHSLPKRLEEQGFPPDRVEKKLDQCEIAVRYQMFHALAAFAIGSAAASRNRRSWRIAGGLFLIGTLLFSGGLCSMVFFDRIGHWFLPGDCCGWSVG
jgi:uncharacterized membrane protein YgdD (TMEM256/DUF423 family)